MKTDQSISHAPLFDALLDRAQRLKPLRMGVVHPCQSDALLGAIQAAKAHLIEPVFFAPKLKLARIAAESGTDLSLYEIVDVPHSHAAASMAVQWAADRRVRALMKGSLHTDELLHAALPKAAGLRTEQLASHVFLLDVPSYPKLLYISDGAIHIAPDLAAKADIVRNAISLARRLGITLPKVAVLSAVETINPKLIATIDAAALCKMVDRGQISHAVIDGPLAFDDAISKLVTNIKGINTPIAGDVDILIAPDLEAGNMLAKQLEYLAGAEVAGVVMGLNVPMVLTSRADAPRARLVSCAAAALCAQDGAK